MATGTQTQTTQQYDPQYGTGFGTGSPMGAMATGGANATNAMQKVSGGEPIYQEPSPAGGMEGNPGSGGYAMPEYEPNTGSGQWYEPAQYRSSQQFDPLQYNPNPGGPMGGGSSSSFSYSQPAYTPNPYLGEQVNNITRGFNRNLTENVLPSLRNRFMASGGLGGSRQGIAEGLATARSGEGLSQAITDLYARDYENSQNRSLQGSIANMNSGLQSRNMELQNEMNRLNSERSFFNANRGMDLQQLGLAAGLLGQANQGFLGQGQGIYNIGNQEQQAPWQQLSNYSGMLAPFQQAGATNSQSQQYSYNPWMQGLGLGIQGAGALGGLGWKPFG